MAVFVSSSFQRSENTSRPMSATNRRASANNQHLATSLRMRMSSMDREHKALSSTTQRRISNIKEELKSQEPNSQMTSPPRHRNARPWSTMTYQRRAAQLRKQIEKKEAEIENRTEERILTGRPVISTHGRPASAPAICHSVNTHEESEFTRVPTARKCFACSKFTYRRKLYSEPTLSGNPWQFPYQQSSLRAPLAVREAWLSRERYLARHLDC